MLCRCEKLVNCSKVIGWLYWRSSTKFSRWALLSFLTSPEVPPAAAAPAGGTTSIVGRHQGCGLWADNAANNVSCVLVVLRCLCHVWRHSADVNNIMELIFHITLASHGVATVKLSREVEALDSPRCCDSDGWAAVHAIWRGLVLWRCSCWEHSNHWQPGVGLSHWLHRTSSAAADPPAGFATQITVVKH